MAKLRPARCYRRIERPYTRVSRVSKYNYVKGNPVPKIRMFVMGKLRDEEAEVIGELYSESTLQIRDNALEAARIAIKNYLTGLLKDNEFRVIFVKYPHHILREHKLANVAKADRFFQGMRLAFGKPIGRAIQVRKGDLLLVFKTLKKYENIVREVLKQALYKLPCKGRIVIKYATAQKTG